MAKYDVVWCDVYRRTILQVTTILWVYAKFYNIVLSIEWILNGHALNFIYLHDSIFCLLYCIIVIIQYAVIIGYCRRCCRNGRFQTSINIILILVDEAKKSNLAQTDIILLIMFSRHCELYDIPDTYR